MPRVHSAHRPKGIVSRRLAVIVSFAGLALAAWGGPAEAGVNLVQNGSFSATSISGSYQFGTGYESGGSPVDTVTDWTTSGYNFVFASAAAADTSPGATGSSGSVELWGPGNGSSNGLTNSPNGGNFIAADGAYEVAPISQTIVGLVPGQAATLTFYWAGAQQSGYTGATTDQWEVSLGTQTLYTPVTDLVSEGFSGWMTETMTFTPTASTEVLSFTAIGTPSGVPPFALLDGVSLTEVPEPASWALVVSGLAMLIFYVRRRRVAASAAVGDVAG
jgi:hypothetical protein